MPNRNVLLSLSDVARRWEATIGHHRNDMDVLRLAAAAKIRLSAEFMDPTPARKGFTATVQQIAPTAPAAAHWVNSPFPPLDRETRSTVTTEQAAFSI